MSESKFDYSLDELKGISEEEILFGRIEFFLSRLTSEFRVEKRRGGLRIIKANTEERVFLDFVICEVIFKYSNYSPKFKSNLVSFPETPWMMEQPVPRTFENVGWAKKTWQRIRKNIKLIERHTDKTPTMISPYQGVSAHSAEDFLSTIKFWYRVSAKYDQFDFPDYFVTKEHAYAKEFFFELKLTDSSANIEPFALKIQLAIDAYLEDAIVIIEQEQKKTGEDYSDVIEAAQELREAQSELSKNQTLEKLSHIWAKARMKSIPFLKSLFTEAAKAFLVEVGKKMIGF